MVACLQTPKEKILEWVHGKTIIPEREEKKIEIIMSMKEDREDWRVVLIQLNPKSIHLRTHY